MWLFLHKEHNFTVLLNDQKKKEFIQTQATTVDWFRSSERFWGRTSLRLGGEY